MKRLEGRRLSGDMEALGDSPLSSVIQVSNDVTIACVARSWALAGAATGGHSPCTSRSNIWIDARCIRSGNGPRRRFMRSASR